MIQTLVQLSGKSLASAPSICLCLSVCLSLSLPLSRSLTSASARLQPFKYVLHTICCLSIFMSFPDFITMSLIECNTRPFLASDRLWCTRFLSLCSFTNTRVTVIRDPSVSVFPRSHFQGTLDIILLLLFHTVALSSAVISAPPPPPSHLHLPRATLSAGLVTQVLSPVRTAYLS